MIRPHLRAALTDGVGRAWRWFIAPPADPVNRVLSLVAGGLLLALAAVVVGVEIAR